MRFLRFECKLIGNSIAAIALHFLQSTAIAQTAPNPHSNPDPIAWPTQQWSQSSPEAQGMDSAALLALLDFGAANDMDSVVVTRHGHLVAEAYFAPFKAGMRHTLNSATKGVVATLAGVAIAQGHLKGVDEPVLGFFEGKGQANSDANLQADADARKSAITVSHLLDMTSGIDWFEPLANNRLPESLFGLQRSRDWVQFVLNRPQKDAPGTRFNYNSGNSQLLTAILTQQTGMQLADYAQRQLFGPLGITNFEWRRDPQGINTGGFGLFLGTRDMAKLGYLVLRNGQWESQQIVPSGWISKIFEASEPMNIDTQIDWRYGHGWWTVPARKAYMAVGFNRQLIVVMPELGVVVTTTGRKNYPFAALLDLIAASVKSNAPLAPNAVALASLVQRQTALATEPEAAALPSAKAKSVSGKTFRLATNDLNLKEFTLHLEGNLEGNLEGRGSYELVSGAARWPDQTRKITRPLGLDGRFAPGQPDKPELAAEGRDVLSKATWLGPTILKIEARRPHDGEAQTYVLEFSGQSVKVTYSNEFGARMQFSGESD